MNMMLHFWGSRAHGWKPILAPAFVYGNTPQNWLRADYDKAHLDSTRFFEIRHGLNLPTIQSEGEIGLLDM